MALIGNFSKYPNEKYDLYDKSIDWAERLQTSAIISAVTIKAIDESDLSTVTTTICPGTGVIVGGRYTTCVIASGVVDKKYQIHHIITTSNGSIFDDYIKVSVVAQSE